jgi:hypothetical protein
MKPRFLAKTPGFRAARVMTVEAAGPYERIAEINGCPARRSYVGKPVSNALAGFLI